MKTNTITQTLQQENKSASRRDITNFYDEATSDYRFWSKDLNMHFGYFIFGRTNPLRRDSMGNEMNRQIYNRLQLPEGSTIVADLGCGMGGTMRNFLKKNPKLSTIGVTLSPFQVQEGNKLLKGKKGLILEENYCDTSMASKSVDGVVGIESLCHSGHSKETLREAYRIVKPGGRFVIADAFLKKEASDLCVGSSFSYRKLCKGWSLDGLGVISKVKEHLKEIGFRNVTVEDISLRVAPSVFHVPFTIVGFLLQQIFQHKKVKPQSWNNLKASFYALLSGLHLNEFGYYIITAEK